MHPVSGGLSQRRNGGYAQASPCQVRCAAPCRSRNAYCCTLLVSASTDGARVGLRVTDGSVRGHSANSIAMARRATDRQRHWAPSIRCNFRTLREGAMAGHSSSGHGASKKNRHSEIHQILYTWADNDTSDLQFGLPLEQQ